VKGGLAQIDADGCDVHVMILLMLTAEQNPTRRRTISLIPITPTTGSECKRLWVLKK
jgi:hypothetical protein